MSHVSFGRVFLLNNVDASERRKTVNYTPGLFFRPAEVSACVVVFAKALTPGSVAGCHGVRERALRPGSVAQSVGDHAP